MSLSCGVLLSVIGPSAKIEANKIRLILIVHYGAKKIYI
jgi:hypothetical protein